MSESESSFIKWIIGISTTIILGLGAWNLVSVVTAQAIDAVQEQRINRLEQDMNSLMKRVDSLIDIQLQLLAEQQKANNRTKYDAERSKN